MEIILLEDIGGLGKRGTAVRVADGYARNFLIPRKKAIEAVGNARAVFKDRERARVALEAKQRQAAEKLRDDLAQISLQFSVEAGEDDQLYGSVTAHESQDPTSAPGVSGPSGRDTGPTLAIVGGRRFTMRDVDSVLASAPPSIREEYSDPEQFKSLVERLAQQWALFLEARRVGTEADPNYRAELAGSQRQLLMKYYYKNLVRNLPAISDSAVHRYYDEHANDFKAPGRARVRHIQVPTQARAREVLKRLRAGSTWDQTCAKYSTDKGNSKTGGVLGYVTTDSDLVPVLGRAPSIVAAAFKIKEGETSEPLKSDRAWHLI